MTKKTTEIAGLHPGSCHNCEHGMKGLDSICGPCVTGSTSRGKVATSKFKRKEDEPWPQNDVPGTKRAEPVKRQKTEAISPTRLDDLLAERDKHTSDDAVILWLSSLSHTDLQLLANAYNVPSKDSLEHDDLIIAIGLEIL